MFFHGFGWAGWLRGARKLRGLRDGMTVQTPHFIRPFQIEEKFRKK